MKKLKAAQPVAPEQRKLAKEIKSLISLAAKYKAAEDRIANATTAAEKIAIAREEVAHRIFQLGATFPVVVTERQSDGSAFLVDDKGKLSSRKRVRL